MSSSFLSWQMPSGGVGGRAPNSKLKGFLPLPTLTSTEPTSAEPLSGPVYRSIFFVSLVCSLFSSKQSCLERPSIRADEVMIIGSPNALFARGEAVRALLGKPHLIRGPKEPGSCHGQSPPGQFIRCFSSVVFFLAATNPGLGAGSRLAWRPQRGLALTPLPQAEIYWPQEENNNPRRLHHLCFQFGALG